MNHVSRISITAIPSNRQLRLWIQRNTLKSRQLYTIEIITDTAKYSSTFIINKIPIYKKLKYGVFPQFTSDKYFRKSEDQENLKTTYSDSKNLEELRRIYE